MNIKKITPLHSKILVTKEVFTADEVEGSIVTKASGTVKEDQTVVSVGNMVRCVKEGDLVHINPARYAVRKYAEDSVKADLMTNQIIGFNIPQVLIDGRNYLLIDEADVEYIINEYEEDAPSKGLIIPSKELLN